MRSRINLIFVIRKFQIGESNLRGISNTEVFFNESLNKISFIFACNIIPLCNGSFIFYSYKCEHFCSEKQNFSN